MGEVSKTICTAFWLEWFTQHIQVPTTDNRSLIGHIYSRDLNGIKTAIQDSDQIKNSGDQNYMKKCIIIVLLLTTQYDILWMYAIICCMSFN